MQTPIVNIGQISIRVHDVDARSGSIATRSDSSSCSTPVRSRFSGAATSG